MEVIKEHKGLLALGGIALFLGFTYTILFSGEGLGLNFPLIAILVLFGGWLVSRRFNRRPDKAAILLVAPILFFAVMVGVRSSFLLTFFNILGAILLLLILADTYANKSLKEYIPADYIKIFVLPLKFIRPLFRTLVDIPVFKKIDTKHPRVREASRGIFMALIALVVFTILFASADAVFLEIVTSPFNWLFSINFDGELLTQLIMFIAASALFIGAFSYMFRETTRPSASVVEARKRSLGPLEIKIFLGSIISLFFVFIVLQLTHFFGGEPHLIAEGLTYAEYARKGFYELILVAILSYLIISLTEKEIVKKENFHLKSFKFLSTFLVVEVLVILASAFTRLLLYENAYGFSTIRLYSHALMIWIGAILILLSYHILSGNSKAKFGMSSFYCVVLLLFVMNLINPDAFIAKKNLEQYRVTGSIDTEYLASLSDDAIPYSIALLTDPNTDIVKKFAHDLYWSRSDLAPSGVSWKSVNFSHSRAENLLAPYRELLVAKSRPLSDQTAIWQSMLMDANNLSDADLKNEITRLLEEWQEDLGQRTGMRLDVYLIVYEERASTDKKFAKGVRSYLLEEYGSCWIASNGSCRE